MAIFIRGNINQGDDCFDVQSRGKQCAFNSLLGLLTAYNKPITQWSPATLNSILLQGDKLYLKAVNNHLIHLPPGVVYLSVKDLPKLVIVSCFENEFNFDISCQTEQNIDLPTGAHSIELPVVESGTKLPVVASDKLPIVVSNTKPPIVVSYNEPPVVVSNTELPIVVSETKLPIVAPVNETSNVTTNVTTSNEEVICVIDYKQELQGLVIVNEEIPSHYYKVHIAIANTLPKYKYAFMILEGFMMALIKHMDCLYFIDPHGRNCLGMPDPNGNAVVMQFANMLELGQYLYRLSEALHSNLFEIVPVQFVNNSSTKNVNFAKSVRLLKNKEFQKAKRSMGNDCERQKRLQKMREYINKKRWEESELTRQTRLDGAKLYQNKKLSLETDLEKENQPKRKRLYQSSGDSQKDYLTAFDISQNGGIEEQSWAKANINKFHKSMKYVVSQCTICFEAWPSRSKPKAPYVCSQCS